MKIKGLRLSLKMTQVEFAATLDCSERIVQLWEQNDRATYDRVVMPVFRAKMARLKMRIEG